MIELKVFSSIKNFFSRLNPLNSFNLKEINVEIDQPVTSDELLEYTLKNYDYFEKIVLIALYHLINTQNVKDEYLTILTKDSKFLCDLVKGDENGVDIPEYVENEPTENILLTCHNHFQKSIIPSSKDFKNVVKPGIKFTIIVSEDNIGIIINELGIKFSQLEEDIQKELKNTWNSYRDYMVLCLANDYPESILRFAEDEDYDDEFLDFFEKYVGENISKFVDVFNSRFKKYNIYYVHIKL